jgi:hypothetical protein
MKRVLRDDQQLAIDELRSAIAEGERRISSRTTVLAGSIIEWALQRGERALFTVPAIGLVDQTSNPSAWKASTRSA